MTVLLSLVRTLGVWLMGVLFKDLVSWIETGVANYLAQKAADKIAQANLAAYNQAIESGDEDAIAKAGQNLLNGTAP